LFFLSLFKKEKGLQQNVEATADKPKKEVEWQEVPAYSETDSKNYELVSVIATAIASGERPESQFVVKRILERNPEAKLVALITSSIAAGNSQTSRLVVKRMAKKS
jgi:sulfite reductase alpha subunit-like flavoprotein